MKILSFRSVSSTGLRPSNHKEFKISYDTSTLLSSYKNVSISSLLLANIVLRACQTSWITSKMAPVYVKYALRYPALFVPFNAIVKKSFFKHFCGGSTNEEILRTTKRLVANGVGSILDPAMETDLKEIDLFPEDRILPQLSMSASSIFDVEVMNERKIVIEDYINAAVIPATELSSGNSSDMDKFVALKLTCVVPTGLLYLLTSSLDFLISKLGENNGKSLDNFGIKKPKQNGDHPTIAELKKEIAVVQRKYPDMSARNLVFSALHPDLLLKFYSNIYLPAHGHTRAITESNDKSLQQSLMSSIAFCKDIFEFAAKKSISIMIDAEQTYFQTAIHYLTFVIARETPLLRSKPVLFGTYQMYLKNGFSSLQQDHQLYSMYKLPFALKVVRGAYMQSESARAVNFGLPSPINDSITKTHEDYSKAIDLLLTAIQNDGESTTAFFATHNVESIEKILSQIDPKAQRSKVMIGQLLGMADHLTLSISNSHLATPYKYVPVGTLQEVLPYLLRRAHENSSLFGRASDERNQIKTVLSEKIKHLLSSLFLKIMVSRNTM